VSDTDNWPIADAARFDSIYLMGECNPTYNAAVRAAAIADGRHAPKILGGVTGMNADEVTVYPDIADPANWPLPVMGEAAQPAWMLTSVGTTLAAALDLTDATAPAQVAGLSATNGDTESVLTWDAASDNVAVTKYRVKRSIASDMSGATTLTDTLNALTYTATGLTNGTTYYFTVEAGDAAGNLGVASAAASATPAASFIFFDDFNRADGALASASWTVNTINANVYANVVRLDGSGGTVYPTGITVTDAKVTAKDRCTDPAGEFGLFIRGDGINTGYWLRSISVWTIVFRMPGQVQLGSAGPARTSSGGDVFELKAVGNVISATKNGTQFMSVTDSTHASGAVGVRAFYADHNPQFDDFKIEAAS
jgi:chitodextrinase